MAAVGMLAVLLGTWEALLSTVGMLKTASPALPREIRRSTRVMREAFELQKGLSLQTHHVLRTCLLCSRARPTCLGGYGRYVTVASICEIIHKGEPESYATALFLRPLKLTTSHFAEGPPVTTGNLPTILYHPTVRVEAASISDRFVPDSSLEYFPEGMTLF
jgi:hypothetical protein